MYSTDLVQFQFIAHIQFFGPSACIHFLKWPISAFAKTWLDDQHLQGSKSVLNNGSKQHFAAIQVENKVLVLNLRSIFKGALDIIHILRQRGKKRVYLSFVYGFVFEKLKHS